MRLARRRPVIAAAGALGVGSAGSGAFRAGMLAAGKDPSDPAAVAAAKGERCKLSCRPLALLAKSRLVFCLLAFLHVGEIGAPPPCKCR